MDARDFKYNGWLADYDLEMSADRYYSSLTRRDWEESWDEEDEDDHIGKDREWWD